MAYTGPGDIVSSGWVSWVGLQAFNAAYATAGNPCADLFDITQGSNTMTVDFLANGLPNMAAVASWAGSDVVGITKLYDQTGGTNHFTNAVSNTFPLLVANVLFSTYPGMQDTGGVKRHLSSPAITQAQPYSLSMYIERTNTGGVFFDILNDHAGGLVPNILFIGANTLRGCSGTNVSLTMADASPHAVQMVMNGASGAYNVDGTDTTSINFGSTGMVAIVNDLGSSPNQNVTTGSIFEMGIYNGALTLTQRNNLAANQATRYAAPPTSISFQLGPDVQSSGFAALALANKIVILSGVAPTSYANAVTNTLGTMAFGIGNCFGAASDNSGPPANMQISSIAVTAGSVTTNGTPTGWAVLDDANSRLLAWGPLSGATAVTIGQSWSLASFTIQVPVQ